MTKNTASEWIFPFGNVVNSRSTYSSSHPSLSAQTTWSHTEAREASLPHSDHVICSQETSTCLDSIGTSGKRYTPTLFQHLKGLHPPYSNII
jgi:hypothetical protein